MLTIKNFRVMEDVPSIRDVVVSREWYMFKMGVEGISYACTINRSLHTYTLSEQNPSGEVIAWRCPIDSDAIKSPSLFAQHLQSVIKSFITNKN
jgi:hypothetical protein